MDMLDFEKERSLICDSMREARRNLRVRFEHATTDRLRTLVIGASQSIATSDA